jgi:uncharacterized phiE125 gp8 family phage protein
MGRLALYTAPTAGLLAVSVAEMKDHLRLDTDDDDATVELCIRAATQKLEGEIGKQLLQATYDYYLDEFPESDDDIIELPRPPLSSVTHVKYVNASGVETTMSSTTDYEVITTVAADPFGGYGHVRLRYNQCWPTTRDERDAVRIRFVAGYDNAGKIPDLARAAIKLQGTLFYEERSPIYITRAGERNKELGKIPHAYDSLVWLLKEWK